MPWHPSWCSTVPTSVIFSHSNCNLPTQFTVPGVRVSIAAWMVLTGVVCQSPAVWAQSKSSQPKGVPPQLVVRPVVRLEFGFTPIGELLLLQLQQEPASVKTGLRTNDVVVALDSLPTQGADLAELTAPLANPASKKPVILTVRRGDALFKLPLKPDAMSIQVALPRPTVSGVGIMLGPSQGEPAQPTVAGVVPNSPASKAGVQVGDTIAAVDGLPTEGLAQNEIPARLRGGVGTSVVLTLRRSGELFDVALVREFLANNDTSNDRMPPTSEARSPVAKLIASAGGEPTVSVGKAGLRPGDVVTAIDGAPTQGKDLQDLSSQLQKADVATVRREGKTLNVALASREPSRGQTTPAKISGVGLQFGGSDNGGLVVTRPFENTPAAQAGLQSGDVITRVDGVPSQEMGFEQAASMIRGQEGTDVILTIRRGDETFDTTLTRQVYTPPR